MKYNTLITCIPNNYKKELKLVDTYRNDQNIGLIQNLIKKKSICKILYNTLISTEKVENILSEIKWTNKFCYSNLNWPDIYRNIAKSTIDTVLRNFQYKFLLRILPTNKSLLIQKITSTNLSFFLSNVYRRFRALVLEV